MSLTLIAIFLAAAEPQATIGHADHLAHGRSVVEHMLHAIARNDRPALDRLVEKGALMANGSEAAPFALPMPPAALGCADPSIGKLEPSDNVFGDSKVTVSWACKDGDLSIRFWVHGGKVIFGERV